MNSDAPTTLVEHFSILEDPRDPSKCRHKLIDIVVIAVAAVLCGANDLANIEAFGKAKIAWFQRFLALENGIPSHDTFGRVFALLSAQAFQACLRGWIESVRTVYEDEVIAIDGKSLRRSHDRKAGLGPLHMVSAWATRNGLVLGQQATQAKSNEITAIPELLEVLMLKGCIVTIDAMGCQKKIAQQIIDQGGDYVLALKGNQGKLAEEVEEAFIDADAQDYAGMATDYYETNERGHGRVETRRYWTLGNLNGIGEAKHWAGLDMIGMVQAKRECDGKTSSEYRFYIGSIGTDAKRFANAVRSHWAIENNLHWSLDVAFREDDSRIRERNLAENAAVLRHIALGLLKADTSTKASIKTKRLTAGWNEDYLAKLLFGQPGHRNPGPSIERAQY
jgi:predicted transposase YbfD/YdcC